MDLVATALAARLHSVFDTDPQPQLALRVRHPERSTWAVHGDALVLESPDGLFPIDLAAHTIGSLADAVAALGFDVPYIDEALAWRTARVLLDGTGDQDQPNGDHLLSLSSTMALLLSALGQALGRGAEAIRAAISQLVLPQSSAEWADLAGSIFGVGRLAGELDADYTQRIIAEVERNRSSPAAILRNIKRLTGEDLEVREPWKEVAYLDSAPLSGGFHFQGAPIYEYHRMQLVARRNPGWDRISAQLDRPAGTIMLPSATHPPTFLVDAMAETAVFDMLRTDHKMAWLRWNAYGLLSDDLVLSDSSAQPQAILSHVLVIGLGDNGLRGPYELVGGGLGWSGAWDARVWSDATSSPREIYPPNDIPA